MSLDERWGVTVSRQYPQYRFFICVRARLTSRLEKVTKDSCGVWTMDTERGCLQLYATCPACLRINNISEHWVESTGRISAECVVCPKCRTHFFPELLGWRSSFKEKIGRLVRQKKEALNGA